MEGRWYVCEVTSARSARGFLLVLTEAAGTEMLQGLQQIIYHVGLEHGKPFSVLKHPHMNLFMDYDPDWPKQQI